jgi:CRP/FNR family transcriptional regulator
VEDGAASLQSDAGFREALAASPLAGLPSATVTGVLAGARALRTPAAGIVRREGQPGSHLELVVTGLVRGFLQGADGRTLTIRYARPGALLGTVSLFDARYAMPGSTQALVPSSLVQLRPGVVLAAVDRDPQLARALLEDLSSRVQEYIAQIHQRAFASVRQRVARHLLDLASERQVGPDHVAPITPQDLADAVGSVREVVVRALGDLRGEGTVETRRRGIVILAPDRLLEAMDAVRV